MAVQESEFYTQIVDQHLGPIKAFLQDPAVSEVLINGYDQIFIETKGKLQKTDAKFLSEDALRVAVAAIAQNVRRRIDDKEPRLDARLSDGSRIAAVLYPLSRFGTCVSIRKFTQTKISFKDYIQMGAITADGAQFLDICMFLGKNVLVSGGTGSGKTTLLSLLCSRIPAGQRLIVIEDSAELNINYDHVLSFETRQADAQGEGEVSIKDLLKSSLRLRPDRIIVGEVRASEAIELINAMNTGHKGCLGTVHANSPQDAIVRVEGLAQSGDNKMSEKALKYQISSAIDIIIQASRFSDGSRRIAEISQVRGLNADGSYEVVPIYKMSRLVRQPDGRLQGQLEPTGEVPTFMEEIIDNKLPFPQSKFVPKAA